MENELGPGELDHEEQDQRPEDIQRCIEIVDIATAKGLTSDAFKAKMPNELGLSIEQVWNIGFGHKGVLPSKKTLERIYQALNDLP